MSADGAHASRHIGGYVCLFVTFAAATLTLGGRLIARRVTKVQLWYDDYIAIVAFLCAIAWFALVIWWLDIGLGRHLIDIQMDSKDILYNNLKLLFFVELVYAFSLAFAKLAILAFYWRMFKTSTIRVPIKVLVVCAVIWLILRTFLAIFHCVPVARFWNADLDGVCSIDDSKFFFGTVLTHLIIDIVILALPVIEVQKLRLPLMQRIGIMGMFTFGIFVCAASVVVLVYSINYDVKSPEMPWNVAPIIIWATAEVNLAIVSACLPMLRPIYLLIIRRPLTQASISGGSKPNSHSHRQQLSHKLATITTTAHDRIESESTHQFAHDRERGESMSSTSSLDDHGNNTVIVGASSAGSAAERRDANGILVTSETRIFVSRTESDGHVPHR